MKTRRFSVLLLSAVVCSGAAPFAQAPLDTKPIVPGVSSDAAQSPSPASTTLSVRGTIEKYDAATRTLSLSTSKGTVRLTVASSARIRQGLHKADASALEKLSGFHAAVRYSESGGNKTVESVHVFGKEREVER